MLNKFFKIIHKKYSTFFNFIFLLRYLFLIFSISMALLLIIPSFFNYENKAKIIKKFILKNYELKLDDYDNIRFQALPLPKLVFSEVVISLDRMPMNLKVKQLKIYPKIFNIYNFENFDAKKIILKDNYISVDASEIINFTKKILNQKNKLFLKNTNIKITNKKNEILSLENVKFANFGYNKNFIFGTIFGKEFKMNVDKKFEYLNLNLLKTGIDISINFEANQKSKNKSGVFKSKILNTNIKFKFDYDGKQLKISNSYFRNKNLSFNNESLITLNPYSDINSKFILEDFSLKLFEKFDLDKFLENKNFIKKINSKSEIFFKPKKFSQNYLDEFYLKIDLAYGRINYLKKILISENIFQCEGDVNLLEELPLLIFDCSIISNDKQKLLKKFSIKSKNKNEALRLNAQGKINIKRKKMIFHKITINEIVTSNNDLEYYNNTFENIFFDKNVYGNFSLKKIRKFIMEVS